MVGKTAGAGSPPMRRDTVFERNPFAGFSLRDTTWISTHGRPILTASSFPSQALPRDPNRFAINGLWRYMSCPAGKRQADAVYVLSVLIKPDLWEPQGNPGADPATCGKILHAPTELVILEVESPQTGRCLATRSKKAMLETPFHDLSLEEKARRFLASQEQNPGTNVAELQDIKEFISWCESQDDQSRRATATGSHDS